MYCCAQLVSYPATLVAIAKFSSFSRPHCTAALLALVLQHKQYITSRYTYYITGVGPRNKNSISYFGAPGQKITKVFAKLFLPMNTGNH